MTLSRTRESLLISAYQTLKLTLTFTHIGASVSHILGKAASTIFWQSQLGWTTSFATAAAAKVHYLQAHRNPEHCQDVIRELWCDRPILEAVWAKNWIIHPATKLGQGLGQGRKAET